jgi:hypothetical protein
MEGLNKKEWEVRVVPFDMARRLVFDHHYARSATKTGVYVHGLFRKGADFLEDYCYGVAWWLPPTKAAAVKTYPEGDWRKVLSLTRLVVHPLVPKNGCSFLLSASIRLIDAHKWHCLVTYADTWMNHTGAIYRATNWEYMGLTNPSPVYVSKHGEYMGKKRGGKNFTHEQMELMKFSYKGKFAKHKFRKILNK